MRGRAERRAALSTRARAHARRHGMAWRIGRAQTAQTAQVMYPDRRRATVSTMNGRRVAMDRQRLYALERWARSDESKPTPRPKESVDREDDIIADENQRQEQRANTRKEQENFSPRWSRYPYASALFALASLSLSLFRLPCPSVKAGQASSLPSPSPGLRPNRIDSNRMHATNEAKECHHQICQYGHEGCYSDVLA